MLLSMGYQNDLLPWYELLRSSKGDSSARKGQERMPCYCRWDTKTCYRGKNYFAVRRAAAVRDDGLAFRPRPLAELHRAASSKVGFPFAAAKQRWPVPDWGCTPLGKMAFVRWAWSTPSRRLVEDDGLRHNLNGIGHSRGRAPKIRIEFRVFGLGRKRGVPTRFQANLGARICTQFVLHGLLRWAWSTPSRRHRDIACYCR